MRDWSSDVCSSDLWGKSLENNPEKFFVKLTSKTINELKRNRKELTNLDESCFPELKNEINELKTKKILQGVGLLIIDGKSFLDFSKYEITKIYEMVCKDRKSTRLNSSHALISYAVFCLKKKKKT